MTDQIIVENDNEEGSNPQVLPLTETEVEAVIAKLLASENMPIPSEAELAQAATALIRDLLRDPQGVHPPPVRPAPTEAEMENLMTGINVQAPPIRLRLTEAELAQAATALLRDPLRDPHGIHPPPMRSDLTEAEIENLMTGINVQAPPAADLTAAEIENLMTGINVQAP